jgi:hypothetical protein
MMEQGYGRIVNIASTEAVQPEPNVSIYAASKGAIFSFTRAIAVDLAPFRILTNAIAPGCIHTPMSIVNGVDETTTDVFQEWYVGKRKIPLARPGKPEEIVAVAAFLASDDCSYVTGQTIIVDGGLTITNQALRAGCWTGDEEQVTFAPGLLTGKRSGPDRGGCRPSRLPTLRPTRSGLRDRSPRKRFRYLSRVSA